MSYISESHPYWSVRSLIEQHTEISMLQFSFYTYRPQSLVDQRTFSSVSRSDFLNEYFIASLMGNTPSNEELAIHSNVTLSDGSIRHIPMVDMFTGSPAHLDKVRPILGNETFLNFDWFKSGRSYHGYGAFLMMDTEWYVQMGKLLLVNQVGVPLIVDPRWVGHRLIAGYAALRWTKNTNCYLDLPRRVK